MTLRFFLPVLALTMLSCSSKPIGFRVYDNDGGRDLASQLAAAASQAGYKVEVVLDKNGISHLGGQSAHAVYFGQGFVHAYYRLAQLEMMSRLTEGTRSEVRGTMALSSDRISLFYGLDRAAQRALEKINAHPETRAILEAYVAGVNAWIARLTPETTPIEFVKSGVKPRPFQAIDSARIMTFVAWALADSVDELKLTRTLGKLGPKDFSDLFPWPDSIENGGVFEANRRYANRPPPKQALIFDDEEIVDISATSFLKPAPNTGSNAFIIRGERTQGKTPILGADFHALYVLPATFIPMQLVSPDFNVIGSSIIGLPMIATGTNGYVAWSYVSSMSDAYDWFRLDIDKNDPTRYKWNGKWRKFETETIEMRPRGAPVEKFIRRTSVAGEMIPAVKKGSQQTEFAYRWAGREGINGLLALHSRMTMKSAADCGLESSRENSPPLNLTCIDREGRNGVWMMSRLPKRPAHQDPRVVMKAVGDRDIWQGYHSSSLSPSIYPLKNPVVLANQFSRSPSGFPYVGWKFSSSDRAVRIQQLLNTNRVWTTDDALNVLSDVTSARTEKVKPDLFAIARRYLANPALGASTCAHRELARLEKWDGLYEPQSHEALFMNSWISLTENVVWANRIGPKTSFAWPQNWKIAELIADDPRSSWWDFKRTPEHESSEEIVRWGLESACEYMERRHANEGVDKLIDLSFPKFQTAFGLPYPNSTGLSPAGTGTTPFLQEGSYGTVYRAIISLEEKPRFWAVATGGPSGHPESPASGMWMTSWAARKVFEIPVMSLGEFKISEKK